MSFDDFMGGGRSLSFQFNTPGDSVTGQILRMEKQQQTDMNDGTPKTFYYRETYIGVPPTSGWTLTKPSSSTEMCPEPQRLKP